MTPTRPPSPLLLYLGLATAGLGFVVITWTWGRVAGLDEVALQLPYVVSGGLTGLGLIIVGATAVNVHAKRREASERERHAQQLLGILHRVTDAVDAAGGRDPSTAAPTESAREDETTSPEPRENSSPSDATQELAWDR